MEKEKGNFLQGCLGCVGLIIILGIVIGGCSIFFGGDDDKKEEKKVDYSTLNEENVKIALANSSSKDKIKFTKIKVESKQVTLTGETTSEYTVEYERIQSILLDTFKQLKGFKDIKYVTVDIATNTVDKYGESSKTKVLNGGIKGTELRKINYEESYNVQLNRIMDIGYVHPVIN